MVVIPPSGFAACERQRAHCSPLKLSLASCIAGDLSPSTSFTLSLLMSTTLDLSSIPQSPDTPDYPAVHFDRVQSGCVPSPPAIGNKVHVRASGDSTSPPLAPQPDVANHTEIQDSWVFALTHHDNRLEFRRIAHCGSESVFTVKGGLSSLRTIFHAAFVHQFSGTRAH